MNVELLKRVQTRLRRMRHPKHFQMPRWAESNECGTAACIGGHGLLMQGYKVDKETLGNWIQMFISPKNRKVEPFRAARREFGLTENQAMRLFEADEWPREFRCDKYGNVIYNNPKVAADRIQVFIDSGGAR